MSILQSNGMSTVVRTLENLNFDNSYVRLPGHFYQRIDPSPLEGTHLISVNPEVARLLDLDPELLNPDELACYFGGHATTDPTPSWITIVRPM